MREEFVLRIPLEAGALRRSLRAQIPARHPRSPGPCWQKKQVEVALATGCDAVAHGCTGKGNDQVRFELTYKALAPQLTVIAPWREWDIISREDAIEYARVRKRADRAVQQEDLQPRPQRVAHLARRRRARRPCQRRSRRDLDAHQEPGRSPQYPGRSDHRLRKRRAGLGGWQAHVRLRTAGDAEPHRRRARHRPHRPGGEPLRRHEVARLLTKPPAVRSSCSPCASWKP